MSKNGEILLSFFSRAIFWRKIVFFQWGDRLQTPPQHPTPAGCLSFLKKSSSEVPEGAGALGKKMPQGLQRPLQSTQIIGVPTSEFFKCAFGPLSSHPFSLILPPSFPFRPCPLSLTRGEFWFGHPYDLNACEQKKVGLPRSSRRRFLLCGRMTDISRSGITAGFFHTAGAETNDFLNGGDPTAVLVSTVKVYISAPDPKPLLARFSGHTPRYLVFLSRDDFFPRHVSPRIGSKHEIRIKTRPSWKFQPLWPVHPRAGHF